MKKIHYGMIVLAMVLSMATSASARISVGISLPNVSIGINVPLFPVLSPVPGYPVYYAPEVDGNYFFYDGMYWIFEGDNWYASSWYNGPWDYMEPEIVPLFVLRIPVAYYRHRPASFRGWRSNEAPRWGQHWGRDWEQRHNGWDRWERRNVPARAPRPEYQRRYNKDHYPRVEDQHSLHNRNYRYQPRDKEVRQHLDARRGNERGSAPEQRNREQNSVKREEQTSQRGSSQTHQQPAEKSKDQKDKKGSDRGQSDNRHEQKNDDERGHGGRN